MVYVDVVIDAPARTPLSYSIAPEQLPDIHSGALVEVPFGRKTVYGVIWALKKRLPSGLDFKSLKPIKRILSTGSWADTSTRHYAAQLNKITGEPIGYCLFRLLPPPGKRNLLPIARPNVPSAKNQLLSKPLKTLHLCAPLSARIKYYAELVKRALAAKQQVLIICPAEIMTIVIHALKANKIALGFISGKESPTNQRQTANKFAMGSLCVLIATRQAIGWQAENLGLLIIEDAFHLAHTDDQSPYLDSASLAALRQRVLPKLKVVIGTGIASSGMVYQEKQGRADRLRTDTPTKQPLFTQLTARSLLTEAAIEAIRTADEKHPVSLIAPAHGVGGVLRCNSCNYTVRCPNCHSLPRLIAANQLLKCYTCAHSGSWPVKCEQCGGSNLIARGIGVDALTKLLKMEFNDISYHHVLITTEQHVHRIQPKERVIFTFADSPLIAPDLRRGERFLSLLADAIGQAANVIIQTHELNSPQWQLFGTTRSEAEQALLKNRKLHALPPFRRRVLLWGDPKHKPNLKLPEHLQLNAWKTSTHAIMELLIEPQHYETILSILRTQLPRSWRLRIDSVLEHGLW